jgi:outer membrane protein OmpA-like peptidoglycan-associated protein
MSDHEHAIHPAPAAAPSEPTGAPLVWEPNAPLSNLLGSLASADPERRDRVVRSLQRTAGNRAVRRAIARDASESHRREAVPSLQRTAGDARVQRMLAVARQPSGGGGGDPDMTGASLIYKDGKWYWKGSLQGVGSAPEIALDPRDIPQQIQDLFKGKPEDKKEPKVFPIPKDGLPPDWLEDVCKRNPMSPLCLMQPGKQPDKKPPDLLNKPVGEFFTFDVLFEQNQPVKTEGGMTSAGASTLALVITLLEDDPTLQVRLVGHASSEGSDEVNLELSKRRARAVKARLDDKKLGARVMDFVGGSKPDGGVRLEFGMWACGEANAAQGEPKPEDRNVAVLFLRNAPVGTGPLKLELPALGH